MMPGFCHSFKGMANRGILKGWEIKKMLLSFPCAKQKKEENVMRKMIL